LYLEQIHSPSDIKGYTPAQRRALAAEMRAALIARASRIGGDLWADPRGIGGVQADNIDDRGWEG